MIQVQGIKNVKCSRTNVPIFEQNLTSQQQLSVLPEVLTPKKKKWAKTTSSFQRTLKTIQRPKL